MRQRLDIAVVDRGLAETRARAQSLIGGGAVAVNGEVVTRSGAPVGPSDEVTLVREPLPYVSRGGLKLAHALAEFHIQVAGSIALDVGASTGGFTDVLLKAGSRRVYAVDVGYGQLAWTLRNDPRVVVMERTNIRDLEVLPDPVDLGVADVSFISLRLVLPVVARLLRPAGEAVVLIKPQFEAGKGQVGKGGVVRDVGVRAQALRDVLRAAEHGDWRVLGLTRSPIRGPAGNVEFLAYLSRDPAAPRVDIEALAEPLARDS
jgi:23S rRNA (cytidine1920-2'-O)/16S rRNA (cytidine1409-2'-O)-methyltransferase